MKLPVAVKKTALQIFLFCLCLIADLAFPVAAFALRDNICHYNAFSVYHDLGKALLKCNYGLKKIAILLCFDQKFEQEKWLIKPPL